MIILYIILAALALVLFVHMSYVYVMGLKRARKAGRLSKYVRVFATVTIGCMVPFYVLLNLTVGTILFLELPKT